MDGWIDKGKREYMQTGMCEKQEGFTNKQSSEDFSMNNNYSLSLRMEQKPRANVCLSALVCNSDLEGCGQPNFTSR